MKKNKEIIIRIFDNAGSFAENKDVAREIRLTHLIPALKNEDDVVLDYSNVDDTTQSFTHALVSDAIRIFGNDVLDRITFKNCTESVRNIINIVVKYMQRTYQKS